MNIYTKIFLLYCGASYFVPDEALVPTNVEVKSTTWNQIIISWQQPLLHNASEIEGYDVKCCYLGKTGNCVITDALSNTTLSYNFTGLKAATTYILFVSITSNSTNKSVVNITETTKEHVPSSPKNLTVQFVTHESINLTWSPPEASNGILQGYKVWYCLLSNTSICIENKTVNATSILIHSLLPYTFYVFYVTAYTNVGSGPSISINNRTLEYIPTPLRNLTSDLVGTQNVTLSWKEPAVGNGIVYYRIYFAELVSGDGSMQFFANVNLTNVVVTGLHEFITYQIFVQPYTIGGGNGTSQNVKVTTKAAVPTGPPLQLLVNASTSTSIELSWKEPEFYSQNGIIQNYSILYYSSSISKSMTIETNETMYLVESLQTHTNYTFEVRAINQIGNGPPANVTTTTLEDVPEHPESFKCDPVSAFQIKLTWNEPNKTNGVVTGYHLQLLSDGVNRTLNETVKEIVIENLEPYTLYQYTLKAKTKVGYGKGVNVSCMTNQSVPEVPESFKCIPISAVQVKLSWNEPNKKNGNITGYHLQLLSNGANETLNETVKEIVIQRLEPYTSYQYLLKAKTKVGYGKGVNVSCMTNQSVPDPPESFKCDPVSALQVKLSWNKPNKTNGIITGYHLQQLSESANETFNETVKEFEILNLVAYTTYHYILKAKTKVGFGNGVNVSCRTNQSAPSVPREVELEAVLHDSVVLKWRPPEQDNGILLGYHVWSCKLNDTTSCSDPVNITPNTTSYNLSSLLPHTWYTFYLNAFTIAGVSVNASIRGKTSEHIPGSIRNLTITDVNERNVSLSWITPNVTNGVVYYKVFYRSLEQEDMEMQYFKNTSMTNIVVTGLEEYFLYEFSVQAFTRGGGHGPHKIIQQRTKPTEPSGSPLDINVESNSSTTLQVSWEMPDFNDRNGIIQSYFISYTSEKTEEVHTGNVTTPTNKTSYHVDKLWKYTAYIVNVSAINQVGMGPSESKRGTTLQDVPGAPDSLVCSMISSKQITLTWEKPSQLNGIIRSYRINHTNAQNEKKSITVNDTVFTLAFGSLHPYMMYNFTLDARTEIGWGESISISCQTNETRPDVPTSLRVMSIGAFYIAVTWAAPINNFGKITGYEVKLSPVEDENGVDQIENVINTAYNFSTAIKPYTSYNFSVRAQTKVGFGSYSSIIANTNESAPSEVRELKLESTSSKAINVRWLAPETKNGMMFYRIFSRFANLTESDDKVVGTNIDANTRHYNLENLEKFVNYTVSVQAYTKGGSSRKVFGSIRTDSDKPSSAPRNFKVIKTGKSYIQLTWMSLLEGDRNGIIDYYRIVYKERDINVTINVTEAETQNITKLRMYINYTFYISAHNDKGFGPVAIGFNRTLPGRPGPPNLNASYVNISETSIRIFWEKPESPNGVLLPYRLTYISFDGKMKIITLRPAATDTSREINNLEIYTLYNISLAAHTSVGEGQADSKLYHTKAVAPATWPTGIHISSQTPYSITITWDYPKKVNGKVLKHVVWYGKNKLNSDSKEENVPFPQTQYTIENLNPNTEYKYKMKRVNEVGEGLYSPIRIGKTAVTKPPLPPAVLPPTIKPSYKTITINLWEADDINGRVEYYYIVVLEAENIDGQPIKPTGTPDSYKQNQLKTYDEYIEARKAGKFYPYIAASISRDDLEKMFVIGEGDITTRKRRATEQYVNGPLLAESTYYYFQRAHVTKDVYVSNAKWGGPAFTAKKPDTTSSSAGPIAGGIVAAIVIILIVIAAVYYYRRHYFRPGTKPSYEQGNSNETFEMDEPVHKPPAHPIKIENFSAYVRNLSKDGKYLFSEEFKLIQMGKSGYSSMYEHSNHPINRDKNRYNNIVAYDHTRVLLQPTEGVPESDYMNANFLDGYLGQSSYIATQGPLENTCDDFWRMCWEQNVHTVVMLTGLEENGRIKCHQYWPEVGTICYGRMQITLTESAYLPTYVVRSFSLMHSEYPGTERFIRHFSLLSWRDHSTANSQDLLAFVRRVNQESQDTSGPIVVHCSAGVGRTGTYIVVDVNLKRIKSERNIEIYNYLQHIRSQRNYMVQTEAQYVFIHDTLLEYLTFGVTEVQARDLREYIKKLQQACEGGGEMKVDKEFHKLNLFDQSSSKTMNAANAACNKNKNRFLNVLPYDDTRVALRQLPGLQGSDYINANYIHGYSQAKQFIATQAPLPQTIPAFWRMIWEHHCMTIVCLAQETEGGKVKIHRYWPSIEAAMHGPLMIENMTESDMGDFIVRDFKVTHTTEGHSRNIKHFQYVGWPDNSHPESASGLVDMIGRVQKWHQQNSIGQIVVHCSAGVGRTGVFIALFNMLERVRVEGVLDVFQTVRTLRTQRPAMVQTKVEYLFCYLALQDFLASFDIYQNFS